MIDDNNVQAIYRFFISKTLYSINLAFNARTIVGLTFNGHSFHKQICFPRATNADYQIGFEMFEKSNECKFADSSS